MSRANANTKSIAIGNGQIFEAMRRQATVKPMVPMTKMLTVRSWNASLEGTVTKIKKLRRKGRKPLRRKQGSVGRIRCQKLKRRNG